MVYNPSLTLTFNFLEQKYPFKCFLGCLRCPALLFMSSLGPESLALRGFWHPGAHSCSFPFLSCNSQTWYFLLLGKKAPLHCCLCLADIAHNIASAFLLLCLLQVLFCSPEWLHAPGPPGASDGPIPSRCSLLHLCLGGCCTRVGPRACLLHTEASIPLPV